MKSIIENVVIPTVCKIFWIDENELLTSSRAIELVHARRVISIIAINDLKLNPTSVCKALDRDRGSVMRLLEKDHLILEHEIYNFLYLKATKECKEMILK